MGEHSEGKALNKKVKGVKFKMARIRKEYKMTEKNLEYTEDEDLVKIKNLIKEAIEKEATDNEKTNCNNIKEESH